MIDYSKFFSNYKCPKCLGKTCITSETSIGSLHRRLFFRTHDDRYLVATCALCGYSELYSLKVLAAGKSEIPAKKTNPAIENAE